MSYFDQVYQQLFGKKSGKSEILVTEVIDRSERFKSDYNKRKETAGFKKFALDIYSSYELKQSSIDKAPVVHLLKSKLANGFAISYNQQMDKVDFHFFFDWLSERTQTLDYQLTNSDLKITEKNAVVESKEKHYLKPRINNKEIIDQQFGNILIEHISINDVPSIIKYTANIYSDRKYQEAQKFDKLAEYLFQDLINQ